MTRPLNNGNHCTDELGVSALGTSRPVDLPVSVRYPIRKHDVIACPPGGPEVAHQIINTGATTMRYLALSTLADVEACEYPDSQKILVVAGPRGGRGLRKLFRAANTVDYYDGEKG